MRRVSSAKICERNFKQETVLSGREAHREREKEGVVSWWGVERKGKVRCMTEIILRHDRQ